VTLRGPELRRAARVLATWLAMSLLLGALGARGARAGLGESAAQLGRQLAELPELTASASALRLNGETVYVASRTTEEPLERVLDRLQGTCRVATRELLADVIGPSDRDGPGYELFSHRTAGEGMVACLVPEARDRDTGLVERLRRFAATQDLAALGSLRYLYARRTPAGRTHVVVAWTEGSFRVDRLVAPGEKEPPGRDPDDAGRPPRSTRLLHAEIADAAPELWVYRLADAPALALDRYQAQLLSRGWRAVAVPRPLTRGYDRSGSELLVMAIAQGPGSELGVVRSR